MKLAFRLLCGALLASVLVACHAPAASQSGTPASTIKLYKVPSGQSQQIAGALGVLLAGKGKNDMGVTQPFPGTLMVLAPPNVQASVGDAIAALGKASTKVASPGRLQVHFWVIDVLPGKGGDSPALQPLAKTLDVLRASLGPSHFSLVSSVSEAATFGKKSYIRTGSARNARYFSFTAHPGRNGGIALDTGYSDQQHPGIGSMQTTVATSSGQYVVLAQAPSTDASAQPAGKVTNPPALLLLVARVDRIESGKQ